MDEGVIKYVALGDSYTIGTGANENEAWPVLLTKHLNDGGIKTELVANPSKNGFSTQNLIDMELPVFDKSGATFVTLLIGVNDWVREVNATTYTKNLIFILDHVQKKLPNKNNILLITIPDFGVTPQGAYFSNDRDVSKGITEFNNIIKAEAKKRGLPVVDIFEISKQMKDNTELTAKDGLHPSAKEYALWETLIFPEAKKVLGK
ncbi:MAG: SGNH/GDSL hydrolase family protein [Sphingobacteriaceae bacterium]|nr:SGNH/GDSL hydrolase family protein [Sphingobacteriaceae bacterium]